MPNNSLTVVGLGIKFLSHVSEEVKTYLKSSPCLLYLVNEPLTKTWLKNLNPSAESLDHLYTSSFNRLDSYNTISDYIIKKFDTHSQICVVLYGHPTVFAQPALEAARLAQKKI